jgi:hypothetical protein
MKPPDREFHVKLTRKETRGWIGENSLRAPSGPPTGSSTFVMGVGEVVAERQWILASYEVAGRAPNKIMRPERTSDCRHPVRTIIPRQGLGSKIRN